MKPSDCPYRPGTPEHNAWIHNVYMAWQRTDPGQLAIRDAFRDHLDQLKREHVESIPAATRAADAVMREVEAATRQEPPMLGLPGLVGRPITVVLSADVRPYLAAMEKAMQAAAQHAYVTIDSLNRAFAAWCETPQPSGTVKPPIAAPSRHAKGRYRRPPAPPAGRCHHGNPRNACRDCSMGRR